MIHGLLDMLLFLALSDTWRIQGRCEMRREAVACWKAAYLAVQYSPKVPWLLASLLFQPQLPSPTFVHASAISA